MAIIEWHEDVWQLFNDHVDYARYEFGEKTANKWLHEMATIDKVATPVSRVIHARTFIKG